MIGSKPSLRSDGKHSAQFIMQVRLFRESLCKLHPPRTTDLGCPTNCFDDFERKGAINRSHSRKLGIVDRQCCLDITRLHIGIIHTAGKQGALDPGQILAIGVFDTLRNDKLNIGNLDFDRLDRNSKISGCLEPAMAVDYLIAIGRCW